MKGWGLLLAFLLAACGGGGPSSPPSGGTGTVTAPPEPDLTPQIEIFTTMPGAPFNAPPKTDYWAAPRRIDMATLDTVNDLGRYRNPSVYGTFALPEGNGDFSERATHFGADCNQSAPLTDVQRLAGKRMLETAETRGEASVWTYDFPALATDFIAKPPYASSYSQAINIHGLWFLYCKTQDAQYKDLAIRAAKAFLLPIRKGGVLNDADGEYWFEELIAPPGYNAYIFNAHAYAIDVLYLTAEQSGDASFKAAADKGLASFNRMLPFLETPDGWTKYDLRPPSPVIYAEFHAQDGNAVTRITATSTNGDSYTLCERACNQSLSSARANNDFKFNINLPSLREFHGRDFTIYLSAEGGTGQFYALTRKPLGPSVYALSSPEMHIQDSGWGQTPEAYQVWHIFLMEDLYSWTGNPLHRETAQRWRGYLADFQAD